MFRPGGVSGGGVVATWPEVQAALAASPVPVTVFLDDSISPCIVPAASGVTNFADLHRLIGLSASGTSLEVEDGATLQDLTYVESVIFSFDVDTTPSLSYSQASSAVVFHGAVTLRRNVASAVAACVLPDGSTLTIAWDYGFPYPSFGTNSIDDNGTGSALFEVGAGSTLFLAVRGTFLFAPDTIVGGGTANLIVSYDTNLLPAFPTFAGFTGTFEISGVGNPVLRDAVFATSAAPFDAIFGDLVAVDASIGDVTVNLPAVGAVVPGSPIVVKVNVTGLNNVHVVASAGTSVEGAPSNSFSGATRASRIYAYSTSVGWLLIGQA